MQIDKIKKKCCICNLQYENPSFDMPALSFNWLEDSPMICEKCIFEKLTGMKKEWRKDCLFLNDYIKVE